MDMDDSDTSYLEFLSDNASKPVLEEDATNQIQIPDSEFNTSDIQIFTEIESDGVNHSSSVLMTTTPMIVDESLQQNITFLNDAENVLWTPSNTFCKEASSLISTTQDVFLEKYEIVRLKSINDCNAVEHHHLQTLNTGQMGTFENPDSTTNNNNNDNIININILSDKVLDEFFMEIAKFQCKLCSHLFDSHEEMWTHLTSNHLKELTYFRLKTINNQPTNLIGLSQSERETSDAQKYKELLIYLCRKCKKAFMKKENLQQHMVMDHNMMHVSDDNLDQSQSDVDSVENEKIDKSSSFTKVVFNKLQKQRKAMSIVRCNRGNCHLRFSTIEMWETHKLCHIDMDQISSTKEVPQNRFKCLHCDEKFTVWRRCSAHMWHSHRINVDLYACPLCTEFKSHSLKRTLEHARIHSDIRPYVCPDCGKRFKQLTQLTNHKLTHQRKRTVNTGKPKPLCLLCNRRFADQKCLNRHITAVHEKQRPHMCALCGHQSATKHMWVLHNRIHTGYKPFKCEICHYETGDHNALRRHKMHHDGVAKYICSHCNYKSIQIGNFKRHMRVKHPGGQGLFYCPLCPYSSVNEKRYTAHIQTCHNNTSATKDEV